MLRVEVIKGGWGALPAQGTLQRMPSSHCKHPGAGWFGGGGTCTPNVAHWSFAQRAPSAPHGLVLAGHPVAPSRLGLVPPELVLALGMLLPSSTAGGSSPPSSTPPAGWPQHWEAAGGDGMEVGAPLPTILIHGVGRVLWLGQKGTPRGGPP